MVLIFFHTAKKNLMSPNVVSEAPKSSKIRFWPGLHFEPR